MTRDEFNAEHPHAFLLRHRGEDSGPQAWTFRTQTVASAPRALLERAENENVRLAPEIADYEVYPVAKAPNNPWPERISVGRAKNNDVVLADNSVSKLHAHFKLVEGTNDYAIVDAGSRNGTRVNETRLQAGVPTTVQVGDAITFGRTKVSFLDGDALYELVARHVVEAE